MAIINVIQGYKIIFKSSFYILDRYTQWSCTASVKLYWSCKGFLNAKRFHSFWWILICIMRLYLCFDFLWQIGHSNCGSTPHSNLMCLFSECDLVYVLPQREHKYSQPSTITWSLLISASDSSWWNVSVTLCLPEQSFSTSWAFVVFVLVVFVCAMSWFSAISRRYIVWYW